MERWYYLAVFNSRRSYDSNHLLVSQSTSRSLTQWRHLVEEIDTAVDTVGKEVGKVVSPPRADEATELDPRIMELEGG
jgi:hypothetical protein